MNPQEIFNALERRFKADKALVKAGRKLYEALAGGRVKTAPNVEVTITDTDAGGDTFDADIDVFRLEFRVFTKDGTTKAANIIIGHLRRVFDDANMKSGEFTTVGMRHTGGSGPTLEDGSYDASLTYDFEVQWVSPEPVTRMV